MQGGRISISVDGRQVGAATRAQLDAYGGKLALAGLDPLANLFFSVWVGPGGNGGRDPLLDRVSVSDDESGRTFDACSVSVFSFSSGTGDVVLTALHIDAAVRVAR